MSLDRRLLNRPANFDITLRQAAAEKKSLKILCFRGEAPEKWSCSMEKIAAYTFSREKASLYGVTLGLLIGVLNAVYPSIDFTLTPSFFGWLATAAVSVVILHEGVHGIVAVLLGYRPILGFRPPLVYVTFQEKIPRGRFIAIALAPLIALDLFFGVLWAMKILEIFSYFCIVVNTIGSIGDIWIAGKLAHHGKDTMVQDTKTGFEVWTTAHSEKS